MQWFWTSWETNNISRLRRMSSAVGVAVCMCAVALCYSVRRSQSVSFVIFRSHVGHILLVLWWYVVLFLRHYAFSLTQIGCWKLFKWRCCVVGVLWFSTIVVICARFWIKRSGLVTPPGGAADPQFPTRPHNFTFIAPYLRSLQISWVKQVSDLKLLLFYTFNTRVGKIVYHKFHGTIFYDVFHPFLFWRYAYADTNLI